MKYVWFVRIFLILVVKTSVIWPLQGESSFLYEDNYNSPLSKMSKVCSFLAETCGKCTELKSCFWCSGSGAGEGSCYARNDLVAKQRCVGKVLSYWRKPCTEETLNVYSSADAERSVLIKLLLLLRKLRDSQNKDHRKAGHKTFLPKGGLKNALPGHINLGDISNKDLPNQVSILPNLTMNTSIQNIIQNVSTVIEQKIKNSTIYIDNHEQNENISSVNSTYQQNTTMALHKLENVSVGRHGDKNGSISCHMNSRTSCLMQPLCSWCDSNHTCCASRKEEKSKLKEKTTVLSKNGSTLICPARSNCETCVADITCYWCEYKTSCYRYPGESYVGRECKGELHHRRCTQEIPVYVIALCIILVTFFVTVGYICVRKCYYFQLKPVEVKLEERPILFKQKNGRTVYQITESEEEDEEEFSRNGKDSYAPSRVGAAPNNPAVW